MHPLPVTHVLYVGMDVDVGDVSTREQLRVSNKRKYRHKTNPNMMVGREDMRWVFFLQYISIMEGVSSGRTMQQLVMCPSK